MAEHSLATTFGIALAYFAMACISHGIGTSLRRWQTNSLLFALGIGLTLLSGPAIDAAAQWLVSATGNGALAGFGLPPMASFLLGFIVADAVAYAIHRLHHAAPLLWALHKVHHSDPTLDASTHLRAHPVAVLVTLAMQMSVSLALGLRFESLIFYGLVANLLQFWVHTPPRLPLKVERALALVFITPRIHHHHHHPERAQHDSGYGTVFSVWDRMFGSLNFSCFASKNTQIAPQVGLRATPASAANAIGDCLLAPMKS